MLTIYRNQVSILRLLGLNSTDLQQQGDELFSELQKDNLDQSLAYDRIKYIDSIYRLFIDSQQEMKDISFYDALNNGLGDVYNANTLLQDFNHVIKNKDILQKAEQQLAMTEHNDSNICSAISCLSVTRNYRERNVSGRGGVDTMTKLYGVSHSDKESRLNDIIIADILDTIHIELYHTMRILPNEITKKEEEIEQEEQKVNEDADDDSLYDRYCDAVSRIIRIKSKSSRFDRGDIDRYGSGGNNKFMTVANEEVIPDRSATSVHNDKNQDSDNKTALAAYQSEVYGNQKLSMKLQRDEVKTKDAEAETMLNAVFDEVECELNGNVEAYESLFDALIRYIIDEQFDSDAFCLDLYENDKGKSSNIIAYLKQRTITNISVAATVELISNICNSMAYNVNIFAVEYQPGFRYFYWDHYKGLNIEENRVYETDTDNWAHESNAGYLISDWYIEPKWVSLKEEATNNAVAPYTTKEFELTWNKAKMKLDSYQSDPTHKSLACGETFWHRLYGIAEGDVPTTEHICALLMYTNFTKNCTSFGGTFRRRTGYETNRKLRQRHSEVANQGRLLRELIEGYGQSMDKDRFPEYDYINTFYHGINKSMVFQSTVMHLCGPVSTSIGTFLFRFCRHFVSTTSTIPIWTDFVTSATTFAANGIVLSILRDDAYKPFIDCGYWSDYSSEREFLFLGGLDPLEMKSVRDIPTNTNYGKWIEALHMLEKIVNGEAVDLRKPMKRDVKYAFQLIVDEIIGIDAFSSIGCSLNNIGIKQYVKKKKPKFIANLFKHWVVNVKKIMMKLDDMFDEDFGYGDYGFKLFLPLIFDQKTQSRPNMKLFLSVFSNLRKFVIFNRVYDDSEHRWTYGLSIDLDDDFSDDLLKAIKISKQSNRKSTLKSIAIAKPKGDIANFIDSHEKAFDELNFRLYSDQFDHSYFGPCEKCLYIAPK